MKKRDLDFAQQYPLIGQGTVGANQKSIMFHLSIRKHVFMIVSGSERMQTALLM